MKFLPSCSFVLLLVLAGCTAYQPTKVPGVEESAARFERISEKDVLAALKCQLARGFEEVERLKREKYSSHPGAKDFVFQQGTGTVSGSYQVLETNAGTINAIFPFSGFDGTNATPSGGRTSSTTSMQLVKRTFEIHPSKGADASVLCNYLEEENISVGSFIEESIVSAFTEIMKVPLTADNKPFMPELISSDIDITTRFTVVLKKEGGFSLKVVPSSPRIDEGVAGATRTRERQEIYTVTTNLPTKEGETKTIKRLLYCEMNDNGDRLCVEEPYTAKRETALRLKLDPLPPAINVGGNSFPIPENLDPYDDEAWSDITEQVLGDPAFEDMQREVKESIEAYRLLLEAYWDTQQGPVF